MSTHHTHSKSTAVWTACTALLAGLLSLSACGGSGSNAVKGLEPVSESQAELSYHEMDAVNALTIHERPFRINGLRIALQAFMNASTPSVSFFAPPRSDYVEVMRCGGGVSLSDGTHELRDLHVAIDDADKELSILQSYDFWAAARRDKDCRIIGTANTGDQSNMIYDGGAPSGDFYYIARACVLEQRLLATEDSSLDTCSRLLAASTLIEGYINKRSEAELEALRIAEEHMAVLDAMGRKIFENTADYNDALVDCEKKENKRIVSTQRKEAISNVLGAGVNIATMIYAGMAQKPELKGDIPIRQKLKTTAEVWGTAIGEGMERQRSGNSISDSLMDLFFKPDDLPVSCVAAKQAEQEGSVLNEQFQEAQDAYVEAMTKAEETAAVNRTMEDTL